MKKILILGGTTEAYELACRLAQIPDCWVTTTLAGRTREPRLPAGELRVGGFGGVEGLVRYLKSQSITHLISATHPFADEISRNAAIAATQAAIPILRLVRPAWKCVPGDRWLEVPNLETAAQVVPTIGRRVFLSIGRQELAHFLDVKTVCFLMRFVDLPKATQAYPLGFQLVQRGPFSLADERSLLQNYQIEVIVSKNSGGDATYAKIEAARELDLPVIMVQRPPMIGSSVTTISAVLDWLNADSQ